MGCVIAIVLAVLALRMAQPEAPGVERGVLPDSWVTGAQCPETPVFRTHEYNPGFFILRQSACTNFEKPFLYLIFGERRVLLVDTGAQSVDVAGAVQQVLDQWSARHAGRKVALVVGHSHGHGDHIAGDAQFKDRPNTTFVAAKVDALQSFFAIKDWPGSVGSYDLGGRVIDVLPIPGHEPASIAIYDRRTGILLTGDTLYPGRLYVRDGAAFAASVARLVAFTRGKTITHILGAHIENARTPYVDYPEGTKYQPDEHALELGRSHLLELNDVLTEMQGNIVRRVLRDFTIWPVEPR
jgi:glyoxylase-like metal-dependent hydrolase (beta-lactamase superfamily II)